MTAPARAIGWRIDVEDPRDRGADGERWRAGCGHRGTLVVPADGTTSTVAAA